MNSLNITYNTEKSPIRYPEYGRGIEELLTFAKSIPDPQKRQKTVESIIAMMQLLNPNRSNMEDYREKLWNHAFAIAGSDLDVTPPPGITIRSEDDRPKAEPVPYPQVGGRMRHYGHNVQKLIKKAIEMPEGSKREGFVEVIASYMKLAYKTWNKEHYVSDDIVKEDLEILSNGQLSLHEGHDSLDKLAAGAGRLDKERNRQRNRNSGGGKNNNRNKRNNNRNTGNGGSGGGNYNKRRKR